MSNKIKTIKTSSMWEFVYRYLEVLQHMGAKCDKGFYRRYVQLTDYVYSKIKLPDCEISDEYYVYEVTMDDGETASKNNENLADKNVK